MTLLDALDAMQGLLRQVPGIKQVQDLTPEDLNEYPQIVYYVTMGAAAPNQHRDAARRTVWRASHTILWVWLAKFETEGKAIRAAVEAIEAMEASLLAGFDRDRFKNTVVSLGPVTPRGMGWIDEDSDRKFSAGLEVTIGINYSIDGGKLDTLGG